MPSIRDKFTNMWTSADKADKERVQTKLADAREELGKLRAEAKAIPLEQARNGTDDLAPIIAAHAKVRAQEDIVAAYESMVVEEGRIEAERQNKAQEAAKRSQITAVNRLATSLDAEFEGIAKCLASERDHWINIHDKLKRLEPLAPGSFLIDHWHGTRPSAIRRLVERELCRVGLFHQNMSGPQPYENLPGVDAVRAHAIGSYGQSDLTHEMPGILTEWKAARAFMVQELETALATGGTPAPPSTGSTNPVAPPPVLQPHPYAGQIPVDPNRADIEAQLNKRDGQPPSPAELDAAATRTLDAMTEGKSLPASPADIDAAAEATLASVQGAPVNPHPEGSEAWQETERVLAKIRGGTNV